MLRKFLGHLYFGSLGCFFCGALFCFSYPRRSAISRALLFFCFPILLAKAKMCLHVVFQIGWLGMVGFLVWLARNDWFPGLVVFRLVSAFWLAFPIWLVRLASAF